jgi:hypothetical protein
MPPKSLTLQENAGNLLVEIKFPDGGLRASRPTDASLNNNLPQQNGQKKAIKYFTISGLNS